MFDSAHHGFANPNLTALLVGIFGVGLGLLGIDLLIFLMKLNVPHESSLRIALTYPHTPKDDSWRPMLDALETARGPAGSHLYETLFFKRSLKFQYPPTSLLYLVPFEILSRDWATRALNVLNVVFFAGFAGTVAAIADIVARRSQFYNASPKISRTEVIVISFAASLMFYPAVQAVNIGQIQMWLDLAFALALLSWLSGKRAFAGALLGFACTIKPQFGILLLWGLLWRDWRFVGGYLGAALPITLLSIFNFGFHNHFEYLKVLSFISERGESYFPNNSINGIVNRLLFNGSMGFVPTEFPPPNDVVFWATRLAFVSFALYGLWPALFHKSGDRPNVIDLSVVMLCATMGSPIAWEHHYGIALPLFVLAFFAALRRSERSKMILIGLWAAWSLSANYTKLIVPLAGTYFNLLQAHLFFGCLWLVWFLGRERADTCVWLDPLQPATNLPCSEGAKLKI